MKHWTSSLFVAFAITTVLSQVAEVDYVIGDTLVLPYAQENQTDEMIDVWFNWGNEPCTEDDTDCYLFARLPNSGAINYNPRYGSSKTTEQLFIPANSDGLSGTIDISFLDDGHNESNAYETAAQATFWQPIMFESNTTGGVWMCGDSLSDLEIEIRTSVLAEYPDYDGWTMTLVRVTGDGLWEVVTEARGTTDASQRHHPLTGWTTVKLVDSFVAFANDSCESGADNLILNVAFGDSMPADDGERFAFYNVLGVDPMSVFLSIDSSTVSFAISHKQFATYDDVSLRFFSSNTGADIPMVGLLYDPMSGNPSLIGCSPPYRFMDYDKFGWFGINLDAVDNNVNGTDYLFAAGDYYIELLYYPFEDADEDSLLFLRQNLPNYWIVWNAPLNYSLISITEDVNDTKSALSLSLTDGLDHNREVKRGKEYTFEIAAALNSSSMLSYTVTQVDSDDSSDDDNDDVDDDDEDGCEDNGMFEYSEDVSTGSMMWMYTVSDECDKKRDLQITIEALPCGVDNSETRKEALMVSQRYSIKSSSGGKNNSNGMSVGAVIGIVCAGVLLVGLAVWWFVMKRGGSRTDGYQTMV